MNNIKLSSQRSLMGYKVEKSKGTVRSNIYCTQIFSYSTSKSEQHCRIQHLQMMLLLYHQPTVVGHSSQDLAIPIFVIQNVEICSYRRGPVRWVL